MVHPDARPGTNSFSQEPSPQPQMVSKIYELPPTEAELWKAGAAGLKEAGVGDFGVFDPKIAPSQPGCVAILYNGPSDIQSLSRVLHFGRQEFEHSGDIERAKKVIAEGAKIEAARIRLGEEARRIDSITII